MVADSLEDLDVVEEEELDCDEERKDYCEDETREAVDQVREYNEDN